MQACTVCHHSTAPEEPFCSSCGHARIVESLQAPVKWPPWFDKALRAGAAVVGVWLILTVGVAFLREAKALRRARTALEAHQADRAYTWVSPFVAAHPNHVEALYLAGHAAIKTSNLPQAGSHYSKLAGLNEDDDAVERVDRLETIYQEQIMSNAAQLECGQGPYAAFYGAYEVLGDPFRDTLVRSAASVARKCVVSGYRRMANEPAYWLINEKKMDAQFVVTALYIEPLTPALEKGEYQLARQLALQGASQWPEGKPQIDDKFSEIRDRVARTAEGMQELCSKLGRDPEFRRGRSACFPESPPAFVASHQDAWSQPVIYAPFSRKEDTPCHRGFELISLGADARRTPDDTVTPAMEFTCRYEWGKPRLRRPDRFWSPQK